MLFATFLISVLFAKPCGSSDSISVTTDAGTFIGCKYTSVLPAEKDGVQFLGIPYAEPPTGDRGFKKPLLKRKLTEPFNASTYGPSCIQSEILVKGVEFSEDCLTLNIFTSLNAINGSGTAVMIWIHGGGFVVGNSDFVDPRHLASFGDVIVVSMNYRVDVFGFLSTGDNVAPGNYGLWDQQLAIRWVNLHIDRFGGDKDRISIFGQSAGGVSVTYQMMYKGNKGLFQRAIAGSGALFTWWAYGKSVQEKLNQFASLMNCSTLQTKAIVNCLKRKTPNELLTVIRKTKYTLDDLPFGPIFDGDFIDYDPASLYESTADDIVERITGIEYLSGICDYDGSIATSFVSPSTFVNGTTKAELEEYAIPRIANKSSEENYIRSHLKRILISKYQNNVDQSSLERRTQLFNLLTDYYFTVPAIKMLWKYKANTDRKAYLYLFSHRPYFSRYPFKGAAHSHDLVYEFGFSKFVEFFTNQTINLSAIPDSELQISKAMMNYWSNFAKTGNPNLPVTDYIPTKWPEYTMDEQKFLEFGATFAEIKQKDHLFADRVALWMDLIPSIKLPEETSHVSDTVGPFKMDMIIALIVIVIVFAVCHKAMVQAGMVLKLFWTSFEEIRERQK